MKNYSTDSSDDTNEVPFAGTNEGNSQQVQRNKIVSTLFVMMKELHFYHHWAEFYPGPCSPEDGCNHIPA